MYTVALAGTPNVGKSTVFNALTGMHQHTGNWAGKTVETSVGSYVHNGETFILADTPGTYSLTHARAEERATRDTISRPDISATLLVADATGLERGIRLALQAGAYSKRLIMCINLMDEAEKLGVRINIQKLSDELGVPVIPTSAARGEGLASLRDEIARVCRGPIGTPRTSADPVRCAERIFEKCVYSPTRKVSVFDHVITSRALGVPIMLVGLAVIFWITLCGANYPSEWLSKLFAALGIFIDRALYALSIPPLIHSALMQGVYTTLSWVIAVMLPPMAIFFPLFTLLEDAGVLPRIAFNLDRVMHRTGAHGKQALTMCMGIGCNACGICGARIIEDENQRHIACVTNSLVPCNGRFPMMLTIISAFFTRALSPAYGALCGALILTFLILLSAGMTFAANYILSHSVFPGSGASLAMELPPYRIPNIRRVLLRSVFDRTLFVLGRAAAVAAPAGLIIWIFANFRIDGVSLIAHTAKFLDPIGRILGLDGIMLLAFILALPANEIVLPVAVMGYTSATLLTEPASIYVLYRILTANGWGMTTAVCALLFTLFHFPCATSLWTVYRESRSAKVTLFSVLVPLITGVFLCGAINLIFG